MPKKCETTLITERALKSRSAYQIGKKLLAMLGLMVCSHTAFADESPFDLSIHVEQGVAVIQLQAVTDHVVLTGFKVNRGNCQSNLGGIDPLPLTFKYGNGVKLFARSCSVKEVILTTDQGTFTYTLKN